jgi:tripeptidyl-peptidase-1
MLSCQSYYIPDHIREHIDYVTPGVKLSAPLKKSTVKRELYERHSRPKPGPFMKPAPKWPGFAWPKPPGAGSLPASIQGCDRNITPACLKALYKIPDAHLADPKNVMGLYESGDTYSQEDLNLFFAKYAPNVPQGTHPTLDSIDGGAAPVAPGSDFNTGESDIDMDIAYSLIYVSSLRKIPCREKY